MSTKKDFVKDGDLEFTEQFIGFHDNLGTYATLFGITPAELTDVENDREYLQFVVVNVTAGKAYSEGWTKLKNETRYGGGGATLPPFPVGIDLTGAPTVVPPNIEGRFRALAKRIKAHPAYTPAIGEVLQIEGEETVFDGSTYKTKLTLQTFMGYVQIAFTKKGVDGVNIYTRLQGQSEWQYLARDTESPYHDTRPLATPGTPETREYVAYGVKKDVQLPLPSDSVSVVFNG